MRILQPIPRARDFRKHMQQVLNRANSDALKGRRAKKSIPAGMTEEDLTQALTVLDGMRRNELFRMNRSELAMLKQQSEDKLRLDPENAALVTDVAVLNHVIAQLDVTLVPTGVILTAGTVEKGVTNAPVGTPSSPSRTG